MMDIPDGEYDIDLSFFNGSSSDETFALRYGFTQDSINTDVPFHLYKSVDNPNAFVMKSESRDSDEPILFEGTTNVSEQAQKNLECVLIYNEASQAFELRQLNSTIRLSKSRNSKNLLKKIDEMDNVQTKTSKLSLDHKPIAKLKTPISRKSSPSPVLSREINNNNKITHLEVPTRATIVKKKPTIPAKASPPIGNKTVNSPPIRTKTVNSPPIRNEKVNSPPIRTIHKPISSKRPPRVATPTLQIEETDDSVPIISESDFEDFNFEFDEDDKKDTTAPIQVTQYNSKKPTISAPIINEIKADTPDTKGDDEDDEFDDLANQLEEVLESESGIEEDEIQMDDGYEGFQIQIDDTEVRPDIKQNIRLNSFNGGSRNGPISLRGLVTGRRNEEDELSSSEEE